MSPTAAVVALLLASGALVVAVAAGPQRTPDPDPSPSLTPEEVVRLQVEALGRVDDPTPGAGIETAFRFASPGNRAATGPLDRFEQMIRMGYPDLLEYTRVEYGPVRVDGEEAIQLVTLVQPDGRRATYLFGLERQAGGAFDGCWMTNVVVPHPEVGGDGLRTI